MLKNAFSCQKYVFKFFNPELMREIQFIRLKKAIYFYVNENVDILRNYKKI